MVFKSDIPCTGEDFALEALLEPIYKIIRLFTDEKTIAFGCNEKFIRIKGENIDFQCPITFGKVKVMDVEDTINKFLKTEPLTSFKVKTKDLRKAFTELNRTVKLEKVGQEIPIIMTLQKDLLYLVTKTPIVRVSFYIDVTEKSKDYEFYVSNLLIKDVLKSEGSVKISVFPAIEYKEVIEEKNDPAVQEEKEHEVLERGNDSIVQKKGAVGAGNDPDEVEYEEVIVEDNDPAVQEEKQKYNPASVLIESLDSEYNLKFLLSLLSEDDLQKDEAETVSPTEQPLEEDETEEIEIIEEDEEDMPHGAE